MSIARTQARVRRVRVRGWGGVKARVRFRVRVEICIVPVSYLALSAIYVIQKIKPLLLGEKGCGKFVVSTLMREEIC